MTDMNNSDKQLNHVTGSGVYFPLPVIKGFVAIHLLTLKIKF